MCHRKTWRVQLQSSELFSLHAFILRKVCMNWIDPAHTRLTSLSGRRVLHQVPEGSIVPPTDPIANLSEPLFDFRSISNFLIPSQEFCDRLVTVCVNHYRIIGYPVCIENDGLYERNEFIFNFALVLDEDADMSAHTSVVRKLARMLRNLEEQSGFLSNEEDEDLWDAMSDDDDEEHDNIESPQKRGLGLSTVPEDEDSRGFSTIKTEKGQKVYALCEMILEDLNNYCECMIPIGGSISFVIFRSKTSRRNSADCLYRRGKHDQPQTLSCQTSSSSCTIMACASPHHSAISSLALQHIRPHTDSHTTIHQWDPFRCSNCSTRRRGPFTCPESCTAPSILWLRLVVGHLSILCCVCTYACNQRLR